MSSSAIRPQIPPEFTQMTPSSHQYANEVANASRTAKRAVDGRMFIHGQRTWSRSGATFEAIDPADGQVFATVALGDKSDVDAAVGAARQAVEQGWAGLPPVRRVRMLNRLAGLLRERTGELAELESLDVGKP